MTTQQPLQIVVTESGREVLRQRAAMKRLYADILKTWALAVHVQNAHPTAQTTQLVKNLQALQTTALCALDLPDEEERL